MSFEMLILGITTLLLLFAWLPGTVAIWRIYGLNRLVSGGFVANPGEHLPEWAQGCALAYDSLRENFPAFAVAILLLAFTGGFSPGTALAAASFLAARLVHISACIAHTSWLRTLAAAAGFLATLYLLLMALLALVSF